MFLQLADLFNLSFMTPKVVPVFKKDSKLDYSNYRPISLLSNIEKILEKLMYKRLYTFLNNNNIIFNLQFEFRQQYSTSHALKVVSARFLIVCFVCLKESTFEIRKNDFYFILKALFILEIIIF